MSYFGDSFWGPEYFGNSFWGAGSNVVVVVTVTTPTIPSGRDKSKKRLSLAIYEDDEIFTIIKVFLNNKELHADPD